MKPDRIRQLVAPPHRNQPLTVLGTILLAEALFAGTLWAAADNSSNAGGFNGTNAAAATATAAHDGNVVLTPDLTPEQLAARIAELIEHLGDAHYVVRQGAQNELYRIGPEAYDALTAAENNPDIEISSRAKYLVQTIRVQWIHDSESPQVRRILDKYELQDEAGRIAALKELAFLRQDVGLAPLCHLLRFEKSPVVSKYTAMLIIDQPESAQYSWAERQKIIEANLARNSGPGAQWLRAYIHYRNDPQGAAADVDKLVDEELAGLVPFTNEIERQNVLLLERRLVKVLEEKFNRRDRALDVLQKQVPLVASDPQAVPDFADLLVQHRAWKLIDQLAGRATVTPASEEIRPTRQPREGTFRELRERELGQSHEEAPATENPIAMAAPLFNSDPALMYTLAHSRRAQGNTKEADELSERAFQLVGNKLEDHKEMGRQLCQLGLFDAAEREYRHVIKSSPQDTTLTIETQFLLSEMLHDQEHDLEAAEVLKTVVDAMDKDATVLQRAKEFENEIPDILRGNMHLFYACHAAAQNKPDEQRRELDEGVKADPTNADTLIGLYETSAHDPARRKQALEYIHAADEHFREEISRMPNDATSYNADAWLIGNTEGDCDLAIQYSQQSLALQPDEAGFLDTLAHCYAGKGDYDNAVKYQTRAAELDPHTLQISKALDKFKQKLAEGQSKMP